MEEEIEEKIDVKESLKGFQRLRVFGGLLIVLVVLTVGIFTAVISTKQNEISKLKDEKVALIEDNNAYEKECQKILANKVIALGYYATSDYTLREAIRTLLSGNADLASIKVDDANDLQRKARDYAAKDDRVKVIDCQGGETN